MSDLIYFTIASLDGYVADEHGTFDWAAPDEQVHAFINDLVRPVGTFLYGRRMYEVMAAWETLDLTGQPPAMLDFAELWRAADKVVYSTTLNAVSTAKTLLHHRFDAIEVEQMKRSTGHLLGIGGPGLAEHALSAGLVDELWVLVAPVVVGGGTPWLPPNLRQDLELVEERRFDAGMVYLRYRVMGTETR